MDASLAAGLSAIAQGFQALSDEKRLQILELLRAGERCVCELADDLEIGQSLLSFHLKTLKESGLVTDRRDGRWVHYRLVPEALADLEQTVRSLRDISGSAANRGDSICR